MSAWKATRRVVDRGVAWLSEDDDELQEASIKTPAVIAQALRPRTLRRFRMPSHGCLRVFRPDFATVKLRLQISR